MPKIITSTPIKIVRNDGKGHQISSRSPRSRPSVVWLYFEFDSEFRNHTVCTICGHTMYWNPDVSCTSSMLNHMRNKHPMELEIAKEEETKRIAREREVRMLPGLQNQQQQQPLHGLIQSQPVLDLQQHLQQKLEPKSISMQEGLPGGDDRGSSEYSQNEEDTAAQPSPEQLLGEAPEREPTPTPAAQTPPKPESYQLRHNNHLTIVLEALARDEAFMDVTLTAQGRSLKAHKSVLSAVSPYFRGVLRDNPCQHPIIIMPRDVRFEELFSIVNYIYKGEMTVAAEDLTSLLKTAEILQVSGLAPSDATAATVNPYTEINNSGNARSSSASSSSSSNVQPSSSKSKTGKGTNQGISIPTSAARPKSPDTMINPSDFMDMDMTYVKEEVQSGDEDDDDDAVMSEPSAQQPEKSPKTNETQPEPVSFSSAYNNQEQNMAASSSSQSTNESTVKSENNSEEISDPEQNKSKEDPQPFVCPYCQGQHRGVENMTNHLRLNHQTKPGFTCNCGRVYTRNLSFQAHIKVCSSSSSS